MTGMICFISGRNLNNACEVTGPPFFWKKKVFKVVKSGTERVFYLNNPIVE